VRAELVDRSTVQRKVGGEYEQRCDECVLQPVGEDCVRDLPADEYPAEFWNADQQCQGPGDGA